MKKAAQLLLITIAAFIAFNCGSSSGPGDTMKNFMKAVENNNVQEAKSYFDPGIIQMLGDEKLTKAINEESERIKSMDGIANIEILEESIEQDIAKVKVKITYGNGETKTDDGKLVQKDGKWLLSASK